MKNIFKISAKSPETHEEVHGLEFPTYESAEIAIHLLPEGVYSINKFYKIDTSITKISPSQFIVAGKTIINQEGKWVAVTKDLTLDEQKAFSNYLNNLTHG